MFHHIPLPDIDVERLGDGVGETLEKVGVLCQNAELLRAMAAQGARVDFQAERAWLPRAVTRRFVESLRAEAADRPAPAPPTFKEPGLTTVNLQIAQFFHDYASGEKRSGGREDFIRLTQFGAALHPRQAVGHALVLSDVPAALEPLEAGLLLAEYAPMPAPPFAWNVEQIPWLREMGEVLGLPNWYACGATAFAHPLRMEKAVADKFVFRLRAGDRGAGLTAMPIAGVTTPVTLGGFAVVSTAEHLATWFAARALRPEVALGGSIWPGTIDMKTGEVSFCAFDALWYGFVTADFIERFCGVRIAVSGGDYCDAKAPGFAAVLEKAYKVMTLAAFTGRHGGIGAGMLEEGKTISPVQVLLERDFTEGLRLYARAPDLSAESVGLEAILDVGLCIDKNFLETDHTMRHFRDALWLPRLLERSGYAGAAQEETVLRRAQSRVDDLIASYKKPAVDRAKIEAMRKVVKRAGEALG